jgi:hypothetical protein
MSVRKFLEGNIAVKRLPVAAACAAVAMTLTTARGEDICALPRSSADIASLSWLAGNWIEAGKARTVRERWAGPYGGVLLGVGVTTQGDATKSFEFFRIAKTPTGLSYFASPNAAPPTEFKAIEICTGKVVFENKGHDFPQRVIYTKGANGTLNARVEGMVKGKLEGEDWQYRPDR